MDAYLSGSYWLVPASPAQSAKNSAIRSFRFGPKAMTPLKVCFISLNSYPLFITNLPGYFGGAELQMSLLAKSLAKNRRFKISLVVGDYGQKSVESIGKITLYKAFRQRQKFSFEALRFFKLLNTINADVYIDRTLNLKIGLVACWCRLFRKKFIYMLAHDWDAQINH